MSTRFKLKGPVPLGLSTHLPTVGSTLGSRSTSKSRLGPTSLQATGSAVVDCTFQYPLQIGKISFRNYYTAWISVWVKRSAIELGEMEDQADSHPKCPDSKVFESEQSTSRPNSERTKVPLSPTDPDLDRRPWEVLLVSKTLMTCPHFEDGSQDHFVIMGTESLIPLKDVVVLRFILHQPSRIWKKFGIEDIHFVKANSPGPKEILDTNLGLTWTLQQSTKSALWGSIVEPESTFEDDPS